MPELEYALQSGSILCLVYTAAFLGFLHTVLGPDHYVPFAALARAEKWRRPKLAWVTILAGLGHVGSSVVIGLILVVLGWAAGSWRESWWASFHEDRGAVAAWLLMGLGAVLMVYGAVQAARRTKHTHAHAHADGSVHVHDHSHEDAHLHPHRRVGRWLTPWMLFIIFVFGPCESLIPLMLAGLATGGWAGTALVTTAFSLTTLLTMLVTVFALHLGLARVASATLDRWATALAGLALILCGGAIKFLGL